MAKQKGPMKKRQLKVFLTAEEHAVVTLAANSKDMNIEKRRGRPSKNTRDYIKMAVMPQAKKDAITRIKRIQNTDLLKKGKTTMAKQKEPEKKKQLKVFLTLEEHAVLTLAANAKETSIGDYMKTAVMQQAKKDAATMMKIVEAITQER